MGLRRGLLNTCNSNRLNTFPSPPPLVEKLQLSLRQALARRIEDWFGKTAMIAISTAPHPGAPHPKKKHSLLPVLTVLFIISYSMMTLLIVEQGSVIESQ